MFHSCLLRLNYRMEIGGSAREMTQERLDKTSEEIREYISHRYPLHSDSCIRSMLSARPAALYLGPNDNNAKVHEYVIKQCRARATVASSIKTDSLILPASPRPAAVIGLITWRR